MPRQIIKNLTFGLSGTLVFLALVTWGWGNWATFFSHPARVGLIILTLAGAIAFGFSESSTFGIGQGEDLSSRWIFVPLIIIAVAFAWLPPHLDRLNRWTIDGDTVRYLGLIITAIGGFVRVATVFELGHRFSIFVAVQSDHMAMFVPIIARIRAEEDFLVREFGEQYRAYQQRTRWRLFPFIY